MLSSCEVRNWLPSTNAKIGDAMIIFLQTRNLVSCFLFRCQKRFHNQYVVSQDSHFCESIFWCVFQKLFCQSQGPSSGSLVSVETRFAKFAQPLSLAMTLARDLFGRVKKWPTRTHKSWIPVTFPQKSLGINPGHGIWITSCLVHRSLVIALFPPNSRPFEWMLVGFYMWTPLKVGPFSRGPKMCHVK